MMWISFLLFSMICHSSCEEQCLNKPCACCRTDNCDKNSTCENGCIDGFWGDRCYYSCPVHCVNCEQNKPSVCDECHDGFYNGFWHDGNSYGPWTDNCINKCNPQCKSCFYYQHCKECVEGYYKTTKVENCTLPCPQRCVSCLAEQDCTECKPGYFGRNCSQLCSKGCNSLTCDKKTGRCNCSSNYMGYLCNYCNHDKYGSDCDLDCPENCFVCNQTDSCLFCKQGYEGPLCIQPISNEPPEKDSNTLSTALGTVFGIVLVIPPVLALLLFWRRRRRKKKAKIKEDHLQPIQNEGSWSPEFHGGISKISANMDMEMSVYDEIPGWSNSANEYSVPFDIDDTKSQSSDDNSGVYRDPVDAQFSDHNVKDADQDGDEKISNYSFAIDTINDVIKEDGNAEDHSNNINVKGEAHCKNEKIAEDNPAFENDESTEDNWRMNIAKDSIASEREDKSVKGKQTYKEDNLNSEHDNVGYEKRTNKRRPKKGLKSKTDYEKLNTGKANEHIYNDDNDKHKTKIERKKIENADNVPDTPGYEKPISFKNRQFFETAGTAKPFEHCGKDRADEKDINLKHEQESDDGTDVVDNIGLEKEKAEKGLHSEEEYEELQKVKNNEHEYEEGEIQLPDYTNVNSKTQSRATFGVFSLA